MRTVGVEEELLLVDATTGEPVSVAAAVLRHAEADGGGALERELKQEQVETGTVPHEELRALADDVRESQVWGRWPMTGPVEVLGSVEAYRRLVEDMLDTGVVLDEGMVYLDARLSRRYPTVELRVADVCLRAEDAALLAGLSRALVQTAAMQWRAGEPAPAVPASLLRLAAWRAGRSGLYDQLLDPLTMRPRPAADVVEQLFAHARPVLADSGDEAYVRRLLDAVLERGTGATRQRETYASTGRLADVVRDAVALSSC